MDRAQPKRDPAETNPREGRRILKWNAWCRVREIMNWPRWWGDEPNETVRRAKDYVDRSWLPARDAFRASYGVDFIRGVPCSTGPCASVREAFRAFIRKGDSADAARRLLGCKNLAEGLPSFFGLLLGLMEPMPGAEDASVPLARDALAEQLEALGSVASQGAERHEAASRPPLSDEARAVLEILKDLPETEGRTAKQLVSELSKRRINVAEDRIKGDIKKELEPYGIRNKRGVGYYIRA